MTSFHRRLRQDRSVANITLVNSGEVMAWNVLAQSQMVGNDPAAITALASSLLPLARARKLSDTQMDILESVLRSIVAFSSSFG